MDSLKIIIHAGIHKTGSTFVQKNLIQNKRMLKSHGIMVMHHARLKKTPIWSVLSRDDSSKKKREKAMDCLLRTLEQLSRTSPDLTTNQRILLLTHESIFGELRQGFSGSTFVKTSENQPGYYRYARQRVERLIRLLQECHQASPHVQAARLSLEVLYFERDVNAFLRSIYNQMIKGGKLAVGVLSENDFVQGADVSFLGKPMRDSLESLKSEFHIRVTELSYEDNIDRSDPSVLLWNFLGYCCGTPDCPRVDPALRASFDSRHIESRTINPTLNPVGLEMARKLRPYFPNGKVWRKTARRYLQACHSKAYGGASSQAQNVSVPRAMLEDPSFAPVNKLGKAILAESYPYFKSKSKWRLFMGAYVLDHCIDE